MEFEDEITRYAYALHVDIDQAREIVCQQRQLAALPRLKPHQLLLIASDKTKAPSKLERYAAAMGITTAQALDRIRAQRELVAQNKDGCARRAATKGQKQTQ